MKETQQSVSSGRLMPSAEETTKTIDLLVEQSSSLKVDQATINEIKGYLEAFPAFDIPWTVGGEVLPRNKVCRRAFEPVAEIRRLPSKSEC